MIFITWKGQHLFCGVHLLFYKDSKKAIEQPLTKGEVELLCIYLNNQLVSPAYGSPGCLQTGSSAVPPILARTPPPPQEVWSGSPPLNLGWPSDLLIECVTVTLCDFRPAETLQLQFLPIDKQPPGKRGLSWTPTWRDVTGWRRKVQQLTAVTKARSKSGSSCVARIRDPCNCAPVKWWF